MWVKVKMKDPGCDGSGVFVQGKARSHRGELPRTA